MEYIFFSLTNRSVPFILPIVGNCCQSAKAEGYRAVLINPADPSNI